MAEYYFCIGVCGGVKSKYWTNTKMQYSCDTKTCIRFGILSIFDHTMSRMRRMFSVIGQEGRVGPETYSNWSLA